MPKQFDCRAYRSERWVAYVTITADTPEDAMQKFRGMEDKGDLSFDDYAEDAESADFFIVEEEDGTEHDHTTTDFFLHSNAKDLLEKAARVVDLWETKNLAEAVRELDKIVKTIQGAQ